MAAALRAQVRQRGLGDPQRAEHVRLDLVAGLLLGQLLDEAELAVAGVVDHDVEPAEVVVGLLDRGEVGVAVGDVERDRQQRVAVLRDQVVERRGVARGGGHLVAALQRGDRPLPAEPRDVPVMNQTFSPCRLLFVGRHCRAYASGLARHARVTHSRRP